MTRDPSRTRTRRAGPARGSRRGLLRGAGCSAALAGAAGVRGGSAAVAGTRRPVSAAAAATRGVAFHGAHQAGIATPSRTACTSPRSTSPTSADRPTGRSCSRTGRAAAARMTAGLEVGDGAVRRRRRGAAGRHGRGAGLPSAGSRSPSASARPSYDAKGAPLRPRRPPAGALVDLPAFPATSSSRRAAAATCASRPAPTTRRSRCTRSATSPGSPSGRPRSAGRSSASAGRRRTTPRQVTPRNLFGFKDGTANLSAEDRPPSTVHVWVGRRTDAAWMAGGSYLVARRSACTSRPGTAARSASRSSIIGRTKPEGAPLRAAREHTSPTSRRGATACRARPLHVRLAHPDATTAARSCCAAATTSSTATTSSAGSTPGCSSSPSSAIRTDAVHPDPAAPGRRGHAERVHQHVGSAVFAIPPGAAKGSFVGAPLFA